jgi:hypothetical protein
MLGEHKIGSVLAVSYQVFLGLLDLSPCASEKNRIAMGCGSPTEYPTSLHKVHGDCTMIVQRVQLGPL